MSSSLRILLFIYFFWKFCSKIDIRNVEFHLKTCIELNIVNVEFQEELNIINIKLQNKSILLYNLKNKLFGYIVKKLRLSVSLDCAEMKFQRVCVFVNGSHALFMGLTSCLIQQIFY